MKTIGFILIIALGYINAEERTKRGVDACGNPPKFPYAEHYGGSGYYGIDSVAKYRCVSGYKIEGKSYLTCGYGGWEKRRIVCKKYNPCAAILCKAGTKCVVINGKGFCKGYDACYKHHCTENQICVPDKNNIDYFCKCKDGYRRVKNKCIEIGCRNPVAPANSAFTDPIKLFYKPGNTITYKCVGFFKLVGKNYHECGAQGQWILGGTCKPLRCPKPVAPPNAYLVATTNTYYNPGDSVKFACKSGFELQGAGKMVCQKTESWVTYGKCVPIVCTNPPTPSNAQLAVVSGPYNIGKRITFVCVGLYELQGAGYVECQADKSWLVVGVCIAIRCPKPMNPDYGTLVPHSAPYGVGKTIKYNCNIGYKFENHEGKIVCQKDKSWKVYGTCIRITCPTPYPPTHAKFVDSATKVNYYPGDKKYFVCIFTPAYTIVGGEHGKGYMKCKYDGTWDVQGYCKAGTCKDRCGRYVGDAHIETKCDCQYGCTSRRHCCPDFRKECKNFY